MIECEPNLIGDLINIATSPAINSPTNKASTQLGTQLLFPGLVYIFTPPFLSTTTAAHRSTFQSLGVTDPFSLHAPVA